ncbi:hypothetical protein BUALT_Bualt04G0002900 [Buddleja alternifolia]|uniref:AB hydrolase-1 domain-containing protein n=1 Tax=Buddleja alternifolia TaxID=168488 RepID=A0AAV6XK26_9LAMI|nr:hypothetical protein BUALT_Bualt04G0002900 [Buddleja alternifolia]
MSTSCATLPNSVKFELFGSKNLSTLHQSSKMNLHFLPRNRCGLSRRDFAFKGIVAAGASVMTSTVSAESSKAQGLEKLPYKPEGYNYWTWRDRKIHYVVEGEGSPIVLIHGFGASAFHWRYNIPELAKNYKVYAVDLLGFGWSEKALIDLGGFTALVAAASLEDQVKGVVLLNSAGQFGDASSATTESEENVLQKFILKPLKEAFQRVVLGFLFWQAKQPSRIESVLKSVYINAANVDDYLIDSITRPADDPNAGEVYYRLMTRFMSNQKKYTLDNVLSQLSCPLLLVWGDLDPWVGPAKALRIKEFYPNTSLVNLQAGHCPHDEVPELVNKALLDWLSNLTSAPSLQVL